jgi:hypothetical protein
MRKVCLSCHNCLLIFHQSPHTNNSLTLYSAHCQICPLEGFSFSHRPFICLSHPMPDDSITSCRGSLQYQTSGSGIIICEIPQLNDSFHFRNVSADFFSRSHVCLVLLQLANYERKPSPCASCVCLFLRLIFAQHTVITSA